MTRRSTSKPVAFADAAWRAAFTLGYQLARIWWFVRRPEQQGAYVAVWVDEELLIIRNSYKSGDTIPCGGIGPDESPLQAARRELAEEVGIEVEAEQLSFARSIVLENEYKHDHAHFFELRLDSHPEIRVDRREVVWGAFVGRDELLGRPLVDAVRQYLEASSG